MYYLDDELYDLPPTPGTVIPYYQDDYSTKLAYTSVLIDSDDEDPEHLGDRPPTPNLNLEYDEPMSLNAASFISLPNDMDEDDDFGRSRRSGSGDDDSL